MRAFFSGFLTCALFVGLVMFSATQVSRSIFFASESEYKVVTAMRQSNDALVVVVGQRDELPERAERSCEGNSEVVIDSYRDADRAEKAKDALRNLTWHRTERRFLDELALWRKSDAGFVIFVRHDPKELVFQMDGDFFDPHSKKEPRARRQLFVSIGDVKRTKRVCDAVAKAIDRELMAWDRTDPADR